MTILFVDKEAKLIHNTSHWDRLCTLMINKTLKITGHVKLDAKVAHMAYLHWKYLFWSFGRSSLATLQIISICFLCTKIMTCQFTEASTKYSTNTNLVTLSIDKSFSRTEMAVQTSSALLVVKSLITPVTTTAGFSHSPFVSRELLFISSVPNSLHSEIAKMDVKINYKKNPNK